MTLTLAEYDEPDKTPIYDQTLPSGDIPADLAYGSGSIIHDFDWSGIGISAADIGAAPVGKKAVQLISPSLVAHAAHVGINGAVTFVATSGTHITRNLETTVYADPGSGNSDIQIIKLDTPIDPVLDKVNPFSVADNASGIDAQSGMPLWIVNRQMQVQLHRSAGNSDNGLLHTHRRSFRDQNVTVGDSGKGMFIVDASERLLLIGTSWTGSSASLLASRKSQIEAVLPPGESIDWVSLSSLILPPAYGPTPQALQFSRTQTQTTRS